MLVYLDTCMWICAVEDPAGRGRPILDEWTRLLDSFQVVFSHLTRMECLVQPLRAGNSRLIDEYEQLWALEKATEVRQADFELAAQLRADHGIKTPDALHLAVAINNGCAEFWTNDNRLHRVDSGKLKVRKLR